MWRLFVCLLKTTCNTNAGDPDMEFCANDSKPQVAGEAAA